MHTYKNPVFLMDHEALKTSEESANLSGGSISHSNTLEPPAPDSTTTSEEKNEATIAGSSTNQGDKCPVQPVNDSTERESANELQNTNEQDFEQSNQPDEFLIKNSRFRNFVRVLQRISDSSATLQKCGGTVWLYCGAALYWRERRVVLEKEISRPAVSLK
ncbi:hypothetical protein TNCT_509681 [Trichonephila clavata]|uniref:Uncharacterized protein n=1 Tax=Trichonephila clavata TaxID=2740835 RepID=A0A8X6JMX3_TRICU|nr:hypothetical protein TNCT_509681 [Trichonephila clavata]